MFPRLYADEACPLPGYEGYVFRLLLNPTQAEINDWQLGALGGVTSGCADCTATTYCDRCQGLRARMGRAAVAIYGTSHVEGFDFSTPDASLATFSMPELPNELLLWLYQVPDARWMARQKDVEKKLRSSWQTGDSTPS